VTWHIHEVEVLRADELDRRTLEQAVVFLADVGGVLDRFARDLVDIRSGTDDADCESERTSSARARTAAKRQGMTLTVVLWRTNYASGKRST
jgi:hypothetical protein